MSGRGQAALRVSAPGRFAVGEIECTVLADGGLDYPRQMLDGISEDDARRLLGDRLAGDTFYMPYNPLLVRTRSTTLLIDAGLGGELAGDLGAPAGMLPCALQDAGIAAADIGVVVLSHAHPDHVGGLSAAGKPSFPSARHVVSLAEWEFWMGEDHPQGLPPDLAELMIQTARTHLSAVDAAGLVDLVDREAEVTPGVWIIPAAGHTPGHIAVAIESAGEAALFCADAFVDDFHVALPQWRPVVDTMPDEAVRARRRLLDRAVSEGCLVAAYHMADRGHVERDRDAYRLVDPAALKQRRAP